jgi:hypothetical protein
MAQVIRPGLDGRRRANKEGSGTRGKQRTGTETRRRQRSRDQEGKSGNQKGREQDPERQGTKARRQGTKTTTQRSNFTSLRRMDLAGLNRLHLPGQKKETTPSWMVEERKNRAYLLAR